MTGIIEAVAGVGLVLLVLALIFTLVAIAAFVGVIIMAFRIINQTMDEMDDMNFDDDFGDNL